MTVWVIVLVSLRLSPTRQLKGQNLENEKPFSCFIRSTSCNDHHQVYANLLPNMGSSMGSYKVNTSGVSSGDKGLSGYGGILRDESGCWIRGFTGHLGTGSMCIVAELLAILKGVELIDSLRLQNTTLETDSLQALRALEKPDLYTKSLDWIAKISDCQKLVKKNDILLSSITPEENKCAKFLAELGMDDDDDEYADVVDPPPGIESIMADKSNVSNDQTWLFVS